MWAVGCIFAEMILKRELFPGRSVSSQIKIIVTQLGTPPDKVETILLAFEIWPKKSNFTKNRILALSHARGQSLSPPKFIALFSKSFILTKFLDNG
jgi:serine/threonine protein kinase